MGSTDFYAIVERLPEIVDSLVVDVADGPRMKIMLFVVLAEGSALTADLTRRIGDSLRHEVSPLHAPDEIHVIERVPRNITGKKLEVPIKRILGGARPDDVLSRDVVEDSRALEPFIVLARALQARREVGASGK
jgi:acetoacetyl-CoA synthetase